MKYFLLSMSLCLSGLLNAQVAVVPQGATAPAGRVTLDVRGAELYSVLDEIARQGRVRISYQREQLGSTRVTAQLKNTSVGDALKKVLANANLQVVPMDGGQIAVVPGRRSVRSESVIRGTVSDAKTNRGVSGATVSVDKESRGVMSDENGAFRLTGVPSGTVIVSVRLLGYTKQSRSITVGEGATVSVDFKLEPSTNVLDQVVVTGTVVASELKSVPNAITVITAKQLEERGITHIEQLFRGDVPGLFALERGTFSTFGQVEMFSRGASKLQNGNVVGAGATNAIKTYVDGVEMADPSYLSQIDPKSIERIEILSGPQASTVYGSNALNGVMQIFTKRGHANKPALTVFLQSGVTQNNFSSGVAPQHDASAQINGTEGRLAYNVGGSWQYTGSWTPGRLINTLNWYGATRAQTTIFSGDISARRSLSRNSQGGDLQQGTVYLRESGVLRLPSTGVGGRTSALESNIKTQTLGITIGYSPKEWWSNELLLGNDVLVTESITGDPAYTVPLDTNRTYRENNSARGSQRYTTAFRIPVATLGNLNLTAGADHWRTRSGSVSADGPGALTGQLPNPQITRDKPMKNTGAFVQGQLGIKEALYFTYGVRAEWNPYAGDDATVLPGRYGIAYTTDIGNLTAKLRGSYGRSTRPAVNGQKQAVRQASASVITYFGPYIRQLENLELGPEFQQGGEGGIELYFGNRGSLVVTRYNQTVDDLILLISGVDSVRALQPGTNPVNNCFSVEGLQPDGYCYIGQQQYMNVASIRNQGWELQGGLNLGPLTTRGTYSWTKSRMQGITPRFRSRFSTQTEYQPGYSFQLLAEHTWSLNFSYAHSRSSLSMNVNGIGQNYLASDAVMQIANTSYRIAVYDQPRIGGLPTTYRGVGKSYATADLNGSHRVSSRTEVTLNVQNFTDYYRNDVSTFYPTAGRQTKIGIRIR